MKAKSDLSVIYIYICMCVCVYMRYKQQWGDEKKAQVAFLKKRNESTNDNLLPAP